MDKINISIQDQIKINLLHFDQLIEDLNFKISELSTTLDLLKQADANYKQRFLDILLNYEYIKLMVVTKATAIKIFKKDIDHNKNSFTNPDDLDFILENSEANLAQLQKLTSNFIHELQEHRKNRFESALSKQNTHSGKINLLKSGVKDIMEFIPDLMTEFTEDIKDIDKIDNDNNLLLFRYISLQSLILKNLCLNEELNCINEKTIDYAESSTNSEIIELCSNISSFISEKIEFCNKINNSLLVVNNQVTDKIKRIPPTIINAFINVNTSLDIKTFENDEYDVTNTYFYNESINKDIKRSKEKTETQINNAAHFFANVSNFVDQTLNTDSVSSDEIQNEATQTDSILEPSNLDSQADSILEPSNLDSLDDFILEPSNLDSLDDSILEPSILEPSNLDSVIETDSLTQSEDKAEERDLTVNADVFSALYNISK